MIKFSKAISFAASLLCIIVLTYCGTPDYSDYAYGVLFDKKSSIACSLGDVLSNETKNLMEVDVLRGQRRNVTMYVRIAPTSDSVELSKAKKDYKETNKKINENHPDTWVSKPGKQFRRAIGIPEEGNGLLTKEGQEPIPCYYFVTEYTDDYSDYGGATIYCRDNQTIELKTISYGERKNRGVNNKLDVKIYKGEEVADMYTQISLTNDVTTTQEAKEELKNIKTKIKKDDQYVYKNTANGRKKSKVIEENEGQIQKIGKNYTEPCYYFVIHYIDEGKRKRK